jgi:hypothetical protein
MHLALGDAGHLGEEVERDLLDRLAVVATRTTPPRWDA